MSDSASSSCFSFQRRFCAICLACTHTPAIPVTHLPIQPSKSSDPYIRRQLDGRADAVDERHHERDRLGWLQLLRSLGKLEANREHMLLRLRETAASQMKGTILSTHTMIQHSGNNTTHLISVLLRSVITKNSRKSSRSFTSCRSGVRGLDCYCRTHALNDAIPFGTTATVPPWRHRRSQWRRTSNPERSSARCAWQPRSTIGSVSSLMVT